MRVPGSSVRIQRRTRSRVPRVLPRRPRASKSALRRSIERPVVRRVRRSDACAPLPCDGRARGDHPAKPCGPGSHALASVRASWAGTSSSSVRDRPRSAASGPNTRTAGILASLAHDLWRARFALRRILPTARMGVKPPSASVAAMSGGGRKIAAATDCLRRNQTATLPRPHAAGRPIDRAPAASEAIGSTTKRPLVAVWEKAH